VLSKVSPGVSYTYKVRKDYAWGPKGATAKEMPTEVTFKVTKSQTTTANLLLNGQLNVASVSGADAKRLQSAGLFSDGKQQVHNAVAFNTASGAVTDVAVRRALIGALNIPELAKIDTGGLGTAADGLVASPKICGGNTTTDHVPAYDPAAAARDLDQAGWTVGAGGVRAKAGKKLSVSLIFSNGEPTNSATAEYIGAQWRKLGVAVKLNEQSFDQTSGVVFGHGAWDATLIDLVVSNQATLVPFFSGPAPTKGNNFGHVDNAQYESHVAEASKKAGTAGCSDWNAAESALFDDADIAPISAAPSVYWGKNAKFRMLMGVLIPTSLQASAG
jgi:peptide/nickel transport system substrate-binding protein